MTRQGDWVRLYPNGLTNMFATLKESPWCTALVVSMKNADTATLVIFDANGRMTVQKDVPRESTDAPKGVPTWGVEQFAFETEKQNTAQNPVDMPPITPNEKIVDSTPAEEMDVDDLILKDEVTPSSQSGTADAPEDLPITETEGLLKGEVEDLPKQGI